MPIGRSFHAQLMASAAVVSLMAAPAAARAADTQFNIAPQSLETALADFSSQSMLPVLATPAVTGAKRTSGVVGVVEPTTALAMLLQGTGLTYRRQGDAFLIVRADADPQAGGAAGGGAEVEGLIVTAQKREENIQDVPIAMSAFSQETLTERQVAGGPDLITQIPNMSFTKTNFTSYSIQIRGIGTQAISATTDPAVAVAFNNTPFIRNRFFEQEFYDLERLEVLRGPQGTLYGRNATAGVVNLISAKPKFTYSAKASADLGNYANQRLEGMVNIPLVEDMVALRLAGAMTKRDGYAFNQMTGKQIDGRDLWSTRMSLRFEPTDWISANFIWEHFQEDDDRLRSGKQLCKKDTGPTEIGGVPVTGFPGGVFGVYTYVTQGCLPVSLYSEEAFQTPNGYSLPYYGPTGNLGNPVLDIDPYLNATQSRDLRVIESSMEPDYRAKSDIGELQISIDLTDSLTLSSETSYSTDELFSLQDYNRFTTTPGAFNPVTAAAGLVTPDGEFCDPQLGCSDRMLLVDLSTSESSQFSQEFRLGSDFEGPFNFSLGANFLRHDAMDKYYVFINSITMFSAWLPFRGSSPPPYEAGVTDNSHCNGGPGGVGDVGPAYDPNDRYGFGCPYIDPNPIGALNDTGRNYFLSKNPYRLISYAAFGEIYYNITPELKVTGGLRFTVDKKRAPQIPSWLLAGVAGPYPVAQIVDQEWREPTGRLALDWSPTLGFTDQTLVYASYAHGYKAGGANPPPPVLVVYGDGGGVEQELLPDTFGPEFVDAFEVGTKNTLFGGALTLNLTGFYYDYEGYQTSEIRNRSAVNSNYDAKVWGAEIEADWRITDALRIGFKGGYNQTEIGDGQEAIDLMDRTAGQPGWIVVRPFPTVPSNCIIPEYVAAAGGVLHVQTSYQQTSPSGICVDAYNDYLDPVTGLPYDPSITDYSMAPKGSFGQPSGEVMGPAYANYIGWDPATAPNGGKGFDKQLGGNELPNAPNYTATVTADYTLPLRGDWLLNLHGDYHYQGESWARVFNSDPYDRIESFSTVNVAGIFANEEAGWKVMAYVKNVFDETAITGAFLNSDDTGLTTNVFLTEPRLYGLRVTKDFTGGGWLESFGERHDGPRPLQIELGGQMSRFDGGAESYTPAWITPALASSLPMQQDDLDWGDVRNVKLTYAPTGGWRISAGYIYGKTKGQGRGAAYEDVPTGYVHNGPLSTIKERDNAAVAAVRDSEEYSVVDFMVGKDIGLGAFGPGGRSTAAAGVRYATFKSSSYMITDGITESYFSPDIGLKYGIERFKNFTTSLDSQREFEGTGPAVSWDAAVRLAGDDEHGHVDLEWTVGGAVLFGKQTMRSTEDRFGESFLDDDGIFGVYAFTTLYNVADFPRARTKDVTVPNLSLSLGASYTIDRLKLSTGYSYDRFFDAIDGGYEEAESHDRTVQGPYFKLSVGFGG
jgi:iron complex outermembrane receptor protein